jgi:adenosylcobinamide-GDP ribazoletransferase
VTRLVIAARYLTIVPIPGAAHSTEGPGVAAAWFPVVGLALGAVLVAVDRVAGAWFAPLLSAVLVVTAWKLVTGGLHLDGLADCLDGSMGRDAAHRLTIMRDSRIGAFGAIGLVLCLMLDVAAVSTIDGASRWRALLAAPVIARAVPVLLARCFSPLASGQGAAFRADLRAGAPVVASLIAVVTAVATLGARGGIACAVAACAALAFAGYMTRRLGGISGDVHGAAIELTELAVLLTAAAR